MSLQTLGSGAYSTAITLNSAQAVRFNAYDSTNKTGTPTYLLGTDASGNVVKTLSSTAPGSLWAASGNNIYNTNSANVGIGYSSPIALLHIRGTGDAIRVESTNTGAGGAQLDLLHYSTSPADGDTMAYINMGGYYDTVPNQAYFASIKTVATDISARQGELTFWTVNSTLQQRMVIDTDGNVGIGTASPGAKLEIGSGNIRLSGTAAYLTNYNGTNQRSRIGYSEATGALEFTNYLGGGYLTFAPSGGSEKMRITTAGNVGIGVTNPSSYWANANNLVVGGLGAVSGITIATDGNLTGSLIFADSTASADNTRGGLQYNHSNDSMLFRVDNDTKMTILSSGNVGIGVTGPSRKLQIDQTSTTAGGFYVYSNSIHTGTGTNSLVSFRQDNASSTGTVLDVRGDGTGDKLIVWDNTAVSLIVKDGGNVGIGTTSIYSKLGVAASSHSNGFSVNRAANTTACLYIGNDGNSTPRIAANNSALTFGKDFAGTWSETMRIEAGGNVGIGTTSPIGKLNIQQSTLDTPFLFAGRYNSENEPVLQMGESTEFSGSSSYGELLIHSFNRDIVFSTQAQATFSNVDTAAMIIEKTNGNVGIGTSSPGSKLQVAGEIRVADGNKGAPSYSFTSDTNTGMYSDAADAIKFTVGGTDTLAMNSSNNVGIGTNAPDVKFHVTANEDGSGIDKGTAKFINTNTGQGATTMHMVQTSSSAYANAVKFWQGSTPTAVGFIRLTTSATQFITSASDLNLKKNITTWSDDTLSKFKALEPKKFRFKTQDTSEDKTLGFIAQNEVDNFPEAYPQFLGEDEKPYYGFNPTGMVPHLMKAIKDLVEKVETLENKITQLENNN